ncbi:alpha/beta fold hydrolase [Candidatus Dojkabacteria bacterium]|nr:alpha/beta fold hydrolase [Candidatus Dojkabacteria bacterium]
MNLTQFSLKLNSKFVKGEYEGNESSGKVVIFSHGFGVKRDSWGMFTQLGDLLKDKFLVVRFDYSKIDEGQNATIVPPLSFQAKMLEKVIEHLQEKFNLKEINIVAHSMGCLVVGILSFENVNKIILLASPVTSPYKRMKEHFSKRPETKFNEQGTSKIKRSNGSWTFIGKKFWKDVKGIDPPKLYSTLSEKAEVYFGRAKQDHVITNETYDAIKNIKDLKYEELDGDHNFADEARQGWLERMVSILSDN